MIGRGLKVFSKNMVCIGAMSFHHSKCLLLRVKDYIKMFYNAFNETKQIRLVDLYRFPKTTLPITINCNESRTQITKNYGNHFTKEVGITSSLNKLLIYYKWTNDQTNKFVSEKKSKKGGWWTDVPWLLCGRVGSFTWISFF